MIVAVGSELLADLCEHFFSIVIFVISTIKATCLVDRRIHARGELELSEMIYTTFV